MQTFNLGMGLPCFGQISQRHYQDFWGKMDDVAIWTEPSQIVKFKPYKETLLLR